MSRSALDAALAELEKGPTGWMLGAEGARSLSRWLEHRGANASGLNDLFKLVAHLQAEGAPAAETLLNVLKAQPTVVEAARSRTSKRESGVRRVRAAFAELEGRSREPSRAPFVDAPRPGGTILGHALMRPLRGRE